jgi:SPP1 family predicted phage head-tail adaptor
MVSNLGKVNLYNVTGAGDLRYRVTFAKRDDITDEYGNVSTGWADQFTVSANIVPRLGGETVMAARLTGMQPVTIRVRKSPDTALITTDWKATDEAGKQYNIRTAVDPLLGDSVHGMFIDMLAESGVAV